MVWWSFKRGMGEVTTYERVYEIEDVQLLGSDELLVSFTTAYFRRQSDSLSGEDPYDFAGDGDSLKALRVPVEVVDSAEENKPDGQAIKKYLNRQVEWETKTYDDFL